MCVLVNIYSVEEAKWENEIGTNVTADMLCGSKGGKGNTFSLWSALVSDLTYLNRL